jgi:hypothetical protein
MALENDPLHTAKITFLNCKSGHLIVEHKVLEIPSTPLVLGESSHHCHFSFQVILPLAQCPSELPAVLSFILRVYSS